MISYIDTGVNLLSYLMIAAGAFLMVSGGAYIAHHVDGDMSVLAVSAFAIGIVWLSQAPTVALRKRLRELESSMRGSSPADRG